MKIYTNYVVYEVTPITDSNNNKILKKVVFRGFVSNSFETHEMAMEAIVKNELTYTDFTILKNIWCSK